MSNSTDSTYTFKPFQFEVLQKNHDGLQCPTGLAGTRMACSDAYLFCSNTSPEFSYPPTKCVRLYFLTILTLIYLTTIMKLMF